MRRSVTTLSVAMPCLLVLTLASAAAQSAPIQVLNYSSYVDSLGYYHVVGEVQNVGSNPLTQVTIAANLCDQSGQSTITIEDYTMIDLMLPQQKSPFDLFENATGNVCGVSLVGSTVSDKLPYRDFQLANQSATADSEGLYHVAGQVTNSGASEAQAVEVVATFYDASGVVVQAGSSVITPSDLPPGGSGSFDVQSDDPAMSARIANFSLQVQSASPILPIPEYPAIVPVLVFSLAAVIVLARRQVDQARDSTHRKRP